MRTATQDANEGNTKFQERQRTSAKFQGNFAVSQEVGVADALGRVSEATTQALSAIGGATSGDVSSVAMEQGAQEGIAEAAKANKRTGFAKFLFGEDASYTTAVKQATKNFANNEAIRQMQELDDNIHLTPDKYRKKMYTQVIQKIQELYKDDKEAQAIAMSTWDRQATKLAREQAAKHIVYGQQQTYVEGVNDLTKQFDIIHLNSQLDSTEDAQNEAREELMALTSKDFVYVTEDGKTASKKASRNIQVKAIEQQLAAGNTTVFQAIPDNFYEGLTVQQMTRMDKAKQSYDHAIAQDSEVIVEEGLLLATQGDLAGLEGQINKLAGIKPRLSGSSLSKAKFAEDMGRMRRHLRTAQEKVARDSLKLDNIKAYYSAREDDTFDAGVAGAVHSKEVQEGADDLVIATSAIRVAAQLGQEPPQTNAEAINLVLSTPSAMETVAIKAEKYGSISPSFAEAAKQTVLNIQPNEQGYISEGDIAKLDNMRTLYAKAPGAMRQALGADASAIIEITLSNSHEPVKSILDKRSNYVKNKALTLTKAELNIPSDQTIGDFVQSKLGGFLDGAAVNYYKEQLETGYRIYGGDTRAAENYMKDMFKVNNQKWKGKVIKNAGLSKYDVPTILSQLEGTGMGAALIGSRIQQDPTNPFRGFGALNDVQMEIQPSTGDLTIQSSQFLYPIVINAGTLDIIASRAEVAKREKFSMELKRRQAVFKEQHQATIDAREPVKQEYQSWRSNIR